MKKEKKIKIETEKRFNEFWENDKNKIKRANSWKWAFFAGFIVMLIFSFVLYATKIGWNFIIQIFMGISTGCFVVFLQEMIHVDEIKQIIKEKEKIKQELIEESKKKQKSK